MRKLMTALFTKMIIGNDLYVCNRELVNLIIRK